MKWRILRRYLRPLLLAVAAMATQAGAHAESIHSLVTVTGVGVAPPMNINSLLPVVNNDSVANDQAVTLMFRPLLWINNDLKIDWSQSMASKVDVSPDRKTFIVTLKPWRWSDGRQVTAQDAVACFQLIVRLGDRYPNAGIGGIPALVSRFTAIGTDRLQVTLKHAVNPLWFELNGLAQIVPIPEFAWQGLSPEALFNRQTDPSLVQVVDGPYVLKHYIHGRMASFVTNPMFSGPKPPLAGITFRMIIDPESVLWGVKTGDLQVGNIPQSLTAAEHSMTRLGTCITNGGYAINYIPLNFTNPKVAFLRDVRVRQALEVAMNQRQLIQVAFHGHGTPGYGPVPSDPDTYLSPSQKWLSAHPMDAFNPGNARSLLVSAGWRMGPDGVRMKNGQRLAFTLMIPAGSQMRLAEAEVLKEQWRVIGVDLSIYSVPFNLELAKLHPHGNWQAALLDWSYSPDFYPTGDGLFNTGGGVNYGGYSDPKMDRLIAKSTQDAGMKSLFAYEDYAAQQLPTLFLPLASFVVKFDPRLTAEQVQEVVWQANARVVAP